MASNLFSRLVPSGNQPSFYEELRTRHNPLDVEDGAGLALDEENLNHQFHDEDFDPDTLAVEGSRATVESTNRITDGRGQGRSHGEPVSRWPVHEDDGDNDVPASLLVEHHEIDTPAKRAARRKAQATRQGAVPGPSSKRTRAQWEATQHQQRLHHDGGFPNTFAGAAAQPNPLMTQVASGSAREKAMWRWVNVSNLDNFMKDVYDYYQGNGMWCILLDRSLHLLEVVFVAAFLTFLTQCVNYGEIPHSRSMSQVLIPQCTRKMSTLWNLGLWIFAFYFIWKSIQFLIDLRRLLNVRDFYVHLLEIPEHDMQTVSWQDVVACIMGLRDQNPKTAANLTREQRRWIGSQSKERLDAHDIANRLMRRENYLIALFNKDILNLSVPLPFMRGRQLLSRTLEWTLIFSILDFVFDEQGQVNQEFLKADRRGQLSQKLRARFVFAGAMNLILAPFLTGYLIIVYFLTYFYEYRENPSALGARSYTPLAQWKFREFNELPHLFKERINMSYPFATRYVDQFPKVNVERFARTVAFVAGAVVTVLAIASLIDPEMFLSFEITHDRTVLFYLGVFGAVYGFARGSISADNSVFDPEYALRNVIEYTHYNPDHWQGRLHSFDVKKDFSELYKVKIVIFIEEILSILITPVILFTSLPRSSDQVIDFFREFTIHVDGLGYVCSFAVFDFRKGIANPKQTGDAVDVRDDYYSTKHGKMAASYYGFLDNYVINPKTGIPGHLPPGVRHQFHPPPAFPGLNSPTLAADMQASRTGRSDRGKSRGTTGIVQAARTPRFGPVPPQPSPMASILLDPHHQPAASTFGTKSVHRLRQPRANYQGESNIIEESLEDGPGEALVKNDSDEIYESGHGLDESAWQTSPSKPLSREASSANMEEPEVGVLGLMYQFQQHMNQRTGGVR